MPRDRDGRFASNGVPAYRRNGGDLPGGGCIALFRTDSIQPSADAGGSIAIEVEDLDRFKEQLRSRGVEFKAEMIHSPVCRMSVIKDSEGNAIILHELKKRDG